MKIDPLFLQPHQARKREPSPYENALADAMERAFAQGLWELDQLTAALNESGVLAPDGKPWTNASFEQELSNLAKG